MHARRFSVRFLPTLLLLLAVIFASTPAAPAQSLPLYTVNSGNDTGPGNELRSIDPVTGATLTNTVITLAGFTVNGATGLALHPDTGVLYAVLRVTPGTVRHLVTIDPGSGVATDLGDLGGLIFASITFAPDGTLYGVTGDGDGTNPEALYTINTTTSAPTLVMALGNGDDGEAIAFNPLDGLIYHFSGIGDANGPGGPIFESINPGTQAVTPITLTGDIVSINDEEILSLTHWAGNWFLVANRDEQLMLVNTSGLTRFFNSLQIANAANIQLPFTDHTIKGLAFGGTPPSCNPLQPLYGAAFINRHGPAVLYSIDPGSGAQTLVGPIGFERVSAIAFSPARVLFANGERMDGTNENVMLTIDPCTGVGTEIGPTGVTAIGGNDVLADLSFRRSDGVLFAYIEADDDLGTVNTATGAVTLTGPTNSAGCCGNGITFFGSNLYHANEVDLSTLDVATGAETILFPLGFSAPADNFPRFSALTVDFMGRVVGALIDGSASAPETHLATLNIGTGAATVLGPTQAGLDAIAAPMADYSLSATASSGPIPPGGSANFTISVNPVGGAFGYEVALSCGTLPAGASCSFSPATVTPGAAPATSTLTITTSASAQALPAERPSFFYAAWVSTLPGLFLVGTVVTRRRRKSATGMVVLAVLLFGMLALAGCGGPNPITTRPVTQPPVISLITVTGTSNPESLERTTEVTLVVQP